MKNRQLVSALIGISIASGVFWSCGSQRNRENNDDFEATVSAVIEAFIAQDSQAVNALIAPELGVAVLHRMGVFDHYRIVNKVDFGNPEPDYLPYPKVDTTATIQYASLPMFDCGTFEWDKTGLYCDTTTSDYKLLKTAQNLIDYRGDSIAADTLDHFDQIGQMSRRIVLATEDGDELIFNLTRYGNRWYLTLIDRVTTDRSA